ncbi:MAG TPA: hypothetical protein PLI09_21130 [Candidatus Hydrogenedentes bacterium]|nr:hypothetical protein [Candidatus Hydrogenedentota bacterium]
MKKTLIVRLVFVLLLVFLLAAIILPAYFRAREFARPMSCQGKLKEIGQMLRIYSKEHKGGVFPPLVDMNGAWVPDLRIIYPKYLFYPDVLSCDSNIHYILAQLKEALGKKTPDWDTAHHLVASQYFYMGWAIHTQEDIDALFSAPQRISGQDFTVNGHTVYWLREGVERFLVKDVNDPAEVAQVQSEIPVMFDNPAAHAHVPHGINVLFLNGYIQFVRMKKEAETLREALETILSRE